MEETVENSDTAYLFDFPNPYEKQLWNEDAISLQDRADTPVNRGQWKKTTALGP